MKNNLKDIKKAERDTRIDLTRKLGPMHSGKPGIHKDKLKKKPKYPPNYSDT